MLRDNIKNGSFSTQNFTIPQMVSGTKEGLPSLKKDLQNAKLYLQKCGQSGESLYDHLANVIAKVIDERPPNVVDYFEQFSERVRLETFHMNEFILEDAVREPQRLDVAKGFLPTLIARYQSNKSITNATNDDKNGNNDETDEDELNEEDWRDFNVTAPIRDLLELQSYWNLLGIGLSRGETFSLSCAIMKLKMNSIIARCRFWGKMFGLHNDYYIAECTLTECALEDRIDVIEKAINIMSLHPSQEELLSLSPDDANSILENNGNGIKSNGADSRTETSSGKTYPNVWNFSMKIPKTTYQPPMEIPAEVTGKGTNRYVYYVCTSLEDGEWIELPAVTPHQINISRRIKKYLTGNLDAKIYSYPTFTGCERNYLRALIARITAGTHIAPRNFYIVDTEEDADTDGDDIEEEVDNVNDKPIIENTSFRPWSLVKLLKLDYWEHHKPEILKQGRVSYFDGNVLKKKDQENSDTEFGDDDRITVDEDEAEVIYNGIIPEIPVPLFASCSGDLMTNETISPWTIRLSDTVDSLVVIRSNLWPGAFAFCTDRICDNIYIGNGHKFSENNYSPPALPLPELEYQIDLKDCEMDVSTIDDEGQHAKNDEEGKGRCSKSLER